MNHTRDTFEAWALGEGLACRDKRGAFYMRFGDAEFFDCWQAASASLAAEYHDAFVKADAEIAALKADAERYRWMRDNAQTDTHFDNTISDSFGGDYMEFRVPFKRVGRCSAPSLDAAIDALTQNQKEDQA